MVFNVEMILRWDDCEIQRQHSIKMLIEILFEYIAIIYLRQNLQLSNW